MLKFDYSVIKSDRRSYTIKISEDNKIVVRAPLAATQRSVERLLEEKRAWIEKALAFNSANALSLPEVLSLKSAYVEGRLVPVLQARRNFIDAEGVHISSASGFRAAYVSSLGDEFVSRFREIEAHTDLKSAGVNFRSYKSRWGCCDGRNDITFNFKLLMLPREYQRYVIVHELCHTVHHDHSAAFWALVKRYEPRFKELRKGLKKYAFLVKLY